MYLDKIKKIKKEIKSEEDLKKMEEDYKKHKDQYVYWIQLLNYIAKNR